MLRRGLRAARAGRARMRSHAQLRAVLDGATPRSAGGRPRGGVGPLDPPMTGDAACSPARRAGDALRRALLHRTNAFCSRPAVDAHCVRATSRDDARSRPGLARACGGERSGRATRRPRLEVPRVRRPAASTAAPGDAVASAVGPRRTAKVDNGVARGRGAARGLRASSRTARGTLRRGRQAERANGAAVHSRGRDDDDDDDAGEQVPRPAAPFAATRRRARARRRAARRRDDVERRGRCPQRRLPRARSVRARVRGGSEGRGAAGSAARGAACGKSPRGRIRLPPATSCCRGDSRLRQKREQRPRGEVVRATTTTRWAAPSRPRGVRRRRAQASADPRCRSSAWEGPRAASTRCRGGVAGACVGARRAVFAAACGCSRRHGERPRDGAAGRPELPPALRRPCAGVRQIPARRARRIAPSSSSGSEMAYRVGAANQRAALESAPSRLGARPPSARPRPERAGRAGRRSAQPARSRRADRASRRTRSSQTCSRWLAAVLDRRVARRRPSPAEGAVVEPRDDHLRSSGAAGGASGAAEVSHAQAARIGGAQGGARPANLGIGRGVGRHVERLKDVEPRGVGRKIGGAPRG